MFQKQFKSFQKHNTFQDMYPEGRNEEDGKICPRTYLLVPQYPLALSTLGSIILGAELPNAKSMLLRLLRRWFSRRLSRSRFFWMIASFLSSSDFSISFLLSSTCCLLSMSFILRLSICRLRSNSCCSRNFWACRACKEKKRIKKS